MDSTDFIEDMDTSEDVNARLLDPDPIADPKITNNDSSIPNNSIDTDEIVRALVENNTDDFVPENSVDTEDIAGGVAGNDTDDFVASENNTNEDEILDSVIDSAINESTEENMDDSHAIENDSTELNNSILDESNDKEDGIANKSGNKSTSTIKADKHCQLPLGRVKSIIKSDPDIQIVSAECIFLMSKSCELFLQWLGKETHAHTIQQKKKTIQKRDLDLAISEHPALEFLEGALD